MRDQHERDSETRRVKSVLRALKLDNIRRHAFARREVRRHYGKRPRCVYCGQSAGTADHVLPQALGGGHLIGNLVPACRPCNGAKGALAPADYFKANPLAAARFVRDAIHADPELRAIAEQYQARRLPPLPKN